MINYIKQLLVGTNSCQRVFIINIILVFVLLMPAQVIAQPNLKSKQTIDGVVVYQDKIKSYQYYYAPSKLMLATNKDGSPMFQLLKMRYTGTKCYSDRGAIHFKNLIQLTINMESYEQSLLKSVSKKLRKSRSIILKPLPLSRIDSQLIMPVVMDDGTTKNESIGEGGNLESTNKSGLSSGKAFWTSRTFTVKLNHHDASLIDNQLKNEQLAMSFDYSFYANTKVKSTDSLELAGSKEVLDAINNMNDSIPEINKTVILNSDAFTIEIDLKRFPDVIKTVDINESIPPTYPAVEIKCYDFTENLRPDLYIKKVEIIAESVDGENDILMDTKFFRKHPELNTQQIYFPYAVNMSAPMRYRVSEINNSGEEIVFEWIIKDECNSLIDVTTKVDDINIIDYQFEVEIDELLFEDTEVESVKMGISYQLNGKFNYKELIFKPNDLNYLKNENLFHDKGSVVEYQLIKNESGKEIITDKETLSQDYIHISQIN